MLVSIGYSACHWCHVMAHESFEDDDTADLMNRLFVNVKVDREERPDVDGVYMDAVQAMTGHGGWPLTIFVTPEGKPFYGGTYFPNESRHGMPSFRDVCRAVDEHWREHRDDASAQAERLTEAVARSGGLEADGRSRARDPRCRVPGPAVPARRGVGRLRPRPQVPADDEPRAAAPGARPQPRADAARRRGHLARRHGLGGHVRPPRRRLRPLLGGRLLDGAPLREDALRPGPAGPPLPPRLAGDRRGPLPPGPGRDRHLRPAGPPPCRRRPVLGRGRRLGGRGGDLLHLAAGGHPGGAGRCRRPGHRVVRGHAARQLRGLQHPPPPRSGRPDPAPGDRGRPGSPLPGPGATGPPGPRRQGPDGVERAHDRHAGRGRGGGRTSPPGSRPPCRSAEFLLASLRDADGTLDAGLAGRRRRSPGRGPAPRLRRRPRRLGRRLHPAGRSHG